MLWSPSCPGCFTFQRPLTPFSQVAVVEPGRGFASIRRVDRKRAVNITASIDTGVTSTDTVIADLNARVLPKVLAGYPGVFFTFEGAMPEQRRAAARLHAGAADDLRVAGSAAAVLRPPPHHHEALPFRLIGTVCGHVVLGLNVSLMSMFGLVALTGVVVIRKSDHG